MKVWLTASEIADAAVEGKLPGLPTTQRGVQKRAVAEGWDRYPAQCRTRNGREGGGGLEYYIDLLPAAARLTYLSSFVKVATSAAERAELAPSIPEGDTLTGTGRRNRDARLAILKAADRYRDDNGLSSVASDGFFVSLYNAGQAEIAPWVRPLVGRLSVRSLARWRAAAKSKGTEALGHDPALNRKDTGVLARAAGGEVRTFILALLAKNQFLSSDHIRNAVIDRFAVRGCLDVGGKLAAVPSRRTFQLQLSAWRAEYANALLKIRDPDGYRSRVEMVALGTSRADRLNECWQIDASPLDAIMLSGKRQVIYAAVDVFSRRTIIMVTATPRAEAVGLLVRKCITAWGVPERIKTDNGSDFTAHATQRLLTALGIEIELSPPYSPRSKPLVERVIGTFQRDFAATIPGFIGHNVGQRSVIEKRKAFGRASDEPLPEDLCRICGAATPALQLLRRYRPQLRRLPKARRRRRAAGRSAAFAIRAALRSSGACAGLHAAGSSMSSQFTKEQWAEVRRASTANIAGIGQVIAIYMAHGSVAPEKIRKDYDDALRQLQAIASGTMVISAAGIESAGTEANEVLTNEPSRPLTADTMTGYI